MVKRNISVLLVIAIIIAVANTSIISIRADDGGSSAPSPYPVGAVSASNHTLVALNDGSIAAFGNNSRGQCGEIISANTITSPNYIKLSTNWRVNLLATGSEHSLALDYGGHIWSWGDNTFGQLGRPVQEYDNIPALVEGLPQDVDFTQIAAGEYHSMALTSDGDLYVWGRNNYFQLGNASLNLSQMPIKMEGKYSAISTKFNHNLAVGEYGGQTGLWAWGNNAKGQLGNPVMSADKSAIPVKVAFPVDYDGIFKANFAVGNQHSVAEIYKQIPDSEHWSGFRTETYFDMIQ